MDTKNDGCPSRPPVMLPKFSVYVCKENNKPLLDLASAALLTYDWPGNIRDLRTSIEHGVVMARGSKITLRDLPMAVRQAARANLPAGVSATEAVGGKTSPLDSARDGNEIDCPGACSDKRQRHRRSQKARH